MKIITGVLLLIVICIGSHSCQKDFIIDNVDSTLITPPAVSGNFTAVIDGAPFVANKFAQASKTLNVIAITGESTDGELILLRVADSGVHVYTLNINSLSNVGAYSKNGGVAFSTNGGTSASQSDGTLSITKIDTVNKRMSGTFSIKVYRQTDQLQKNITTGVFTNISYTTTPIPPSSATDTFKVKTDGAQFPVFSVNGISAFGMINISASNSAVTKTVGLSFPINITPGAYTISLFGPEYIAQYNIGNSYLAGDSGSLTIIEHNTTTKRVRGNFNFHGAELLGTQESELTEGYFSVVYQ
ncbi:MAG: DUF6252 family protein [Ginsengibacter sp.]